MTIALLIVLLITLGVLAALTRIGDAWIGRAHAPAGRFVEVTGGRLHIVELGPDRPAPGDIPLVFIHGASGNLEDMRLALGDRLPGRWRVILIDRPGRGASERRGGRQDSSPSRQAALVRDVLDRLGISRAILVAHSWGGALATAFAVDHPTWVAGLVLLAPVTHPWPGGIAWYYHAASAPIVGRLFAHTLVLPIGSLLLDATVASVFAPQPVPQNYVLRASIRMVLRPEGFHANACDVADLKANVAAKAARYHEIQAPTVILAGDCDQTVSPKIHAQALAAVLPNARLEMLPGIGHMVHYAAPDRVLAAIEEVAARIGKDVRMELLS